MRALLAVAVIAASLMLAPRATNASLFADMLDDNDDEDRDEYVYPAVREIAAESATGATLMVQGRLYGWEHLRAFDSAEHCEGVRTVLRDDPKYIDEVFDGLATYVAGRATKCVLAGGS